jgi:3-carboxy-cis,cis-muconate cycloisomerase
MFGLTAVCLKKANWLSENLRLDAEQMQANIDVSQGLMMAEALSFELAKQMPRAEAKILIRNAVAKVLSDGGHLTEVLGHMTELKLEPSNFKEENYLGETQRFIDLVLDEVKKTYE